jgi:hypothetical protein
MITPCGLIVRRTFLALCFFGVLIGPVIDAGEPPVSIHIFTAHDPSGLVSEGEKERRDSVKDLEDAVRRYRGLVVVPSPENAILSLEVIARERQDSGKRVGIATPNGTGGYSTASVPLETAILRVRLIAGGHSEEIVGTGRRYWSRAASDVAERLAKWVARNKELLESK